MVEYKTISDISTGRDAPLLTMDNGFDTSIRKYG